MEWKTIPSFSEYEVNALGQIRRKLKKKYFLNLLVHMVIIK